MAKRPRSGAGGATGIPDVLAECREPRDLRADRLFRRGGNESGGTARVATFAGGWGVACEQPGLRSAFGVAGTGARAAEPAYDAWPHRMHWSDGSTAGYGPEAGIGPNELAYLTIAGQDCLYNVWSRLGRTHLEQLLASIRFVGID